jgi:SAM-dependent methyltransferase
MDCQALSFDAEFDAVFSNAAMHWMKDLDAVLAGAHRALRPGGRFVGEFGGFGNVAAICVALFAVLERYGLHGADFMPWIFPSAEEFSAALTTAGFQPRLVQLIPRPTPLPTDMEGWLETFATPLLTGLAEADRRPAMRAAADLLRPCLCRSDGQWFADYVRLRFAAVK